jgi:hypothetical protein
MEAVGCIIAVGQDGNMEILFALRSSRPQGDGRCGNARPKPTSNLAVADFLGWSGGIGQNIDVN